MSTRFVRIAAALIAVSAPLAAAGAQEVTTGASLVDAPRDDAVSARKYCVAFVPTGSSVERKVCKTRTDWIEQTGVDPARK